MRIAGGNPRLTDFVPSMTSAPDFLKQLSRAGIRRAGLNPESRVRTRALHDGFGGGGHGRRASNCPFCCFVTMWAAVLR